MNLPSLERILIIKIIKNEKDEKIILYIFLRLIVTMVLFFIYIRSLLINMGADSTMIEMKSCGYKPYQILLLEEINEYFNFKDILDQAFISNLPIQIRPVAEKYNRRIIVSVRLVDNKEYIMYHPVSCLINNHSEARYKQINQLKTK